MVLIQSLKETATKNWECPGKDSPQKVATREIMRNYLKNNDIGIKGGAVVDSIICDMRSVLLEDVLDEESEEELGVF
mgnify:CR=1 FL=1